MTGQRPPPTTSKYHRHGASFHGSPVEARTRSDDRSCARTGSSPCAISARIERRRHAEHVDAVPLDERPQPVGSGIVGRAVVEHERAAVGERADDLPRPHDPADVGEPEQPLAARAGRSGTRPPRRSSRGSRRARAPRPSAGRSCRSCTRRTAGARCRRDRVEAIGAGRGQVGEREVAPGVHRHVGATEPRHDDDRVHASAPARPRRRRSPSSARPCRAA